MTDTAAFGNALTDLLAECVVQVRGRWGGSGFWVTPAQVLTCAHVVDGAESVTVRWRGTDYAASVLQQLPATRPPDRETMSLPDIALLEVSGADATEHPCVLLDRGDITHGADADELWLGYASRGEHTDERGLGHGAGQVRVSGIHHEDDVGSLVVVRGRQVVSGNSGGPLLSARTEGVCAVIQSARVDSSGMGVPVSSFIDDLAGLWERNRVAHQLDPRWKVATAKVRMADLIDRGLIVWNARTFALGSGRHAHVGASPAEVGDRVDVHTLLGGHLPTLARDHARLVERFTQWLRPDKQRKRGAVRFRMFWIESDDEFARGCARLACLASTPNGGLGHDRTVVDASDDAALWCDAVIAAVGASHPAAAPVVSVDAAQAPASKLRALVTALRRAQAAAPAAADDPLPRLVVSGPRAVHTEFREVLRRLVQGDGVQPTGVDAPDPLRGEVAAASGGRGRGIRDRGMPTTTPRLFGRDAELARLDRAWCREDVQIVSFIAAGGSGKSALVKSWMDAASGKSALVKSSMDAATTERRPGIPAGEVSDVFAWSFYSQGTKDYMVSADPFVNAALKWLGADDDVLGQTPAEKGMALATLIREQYRAPSDRLLLVLDGLEPLQHGRQSVQPGVLTDISVRTLLTELARSAWSGLCVITSRVPLTDLDRWSPSYTTHNLDHLGADASVALLRYLQVRGAADELRAAADEMDGHALALTLLGNYLRRWHGGDVRMRVDLADPLTNVEPEQGGHARRIMESYVRRFEERDRDDALALLDMIGLFDRPAPPDALGALLSGLDACRFTGQFARIDTPAWDTCVTDLRDMGLLNRPLPDRPRDIDAHPLVREHFRARLRDHRPDEWSRGNRRLYEHFKQEAAPTPTERRDMQVLYMAVGHGAEADLHQQVFDDVLLPRVWHDRRTNYSTRRLGMTGSDLAALSHFFARRWTDLVDGLRPDARVLALTNAGVRLRQLGRLDEARSCFTATAREIEAHGVGETARADASYAAAQNSELLVIAGKLAAGDARVGAGADATQHALGSARQAVAYAGDGRDAADPYFQMHARSTLAEVHHMRGDLDAAQRFFEEARRIDDEDDPQPPFLYSQSLYRYTYYLIDRGRAGEIEELASDEHFGRWITPDGDDVSSRLSKAIRWLARAAARRAMHEQSSQPRRFLDETESFLARALVEFKESGYTDYEVRGRIEMITFLRARDGAGDLVEAREHHSEAMYDAARGGMTLLRCDAELQMLVFEALSLSRLSAPEGPALAADLRTRLDDLCAERAEIGYRRDASLLDTTGRQLQRFEQ